GDRFQRFLLGERTKTALGTTWGRPSGPYHNRGRSRNRASEIQRELVAVPERAPVMWSEAMSLDRRAVLSRAVAGVALPSVCREGCGKFGHETVARHLGHDCRRGDTHDGRITLHNEGAGKVGELLHD